MVYVIGSVLSFAALYAIWFATPMDAVIFARHYATLCAILFAELEGGIELHQAK